MRLECRYFVNNPCFQPGTIILEKLAAEESQSDLNSDENREIVQQFLEMFKKENLDKK